MSQQKRGRDSTAWMSLAGLGLEFAAAVAGFAALGWWLDREFGTEPAALIICAALGLIGGMYNLIRQSLKAARRAEEERKHKGSSGEQDRHS